MKKILSTIKLWLQAEKAALAARRHESHVAAVKAEASERIQVMEFEGWLYISYDGTPLLREEYLGQCGETVVSRVREDYVRYKLSRHERRG